MKLYELTAHETRDMLRKKEISAKEVLDDTYSRIDKVEAKISSYITLTREKAYKDAEIIDKVINEGENLPDLAGIPMALKDNMCTEGVETTCASKILKGFKPPYNAEVYSRLLNEGSIMVGKANMDEFAMGSSTENSSVKVTKNPWDIERVPGGSSGGSAAAVAAGEAYFSLGSDTGGSIRQPASLCGVVGMKPTYGLVSRYGLVAFASSFDQIGPITRDVEDCALVMNCIAGHDPKDSTSVDVPKYDYKSALVNDVKGFKIGLPKEYFEEGIDSEIKKIVLDQVKVLEGLGAHVEEMSLPYSRYALQVRALIKQDFDRAFEKYDVIISPTAPTTAFRIGEKTSDPLSMYMSDICTVPVNIAGNTAISIPCGRSDGLPVGMQIIGKPLDEKSILQVAYTYEKNTRFNDNKPVL